MPLSNVLITRFGHPETREILEEVFSSFSIQTIADLCVHKESIPNIPGTKTIWIPSRRAKWGDYDVDWNAIPPLDPPLLEEMRNDEPVIFELCNRLLMDADMPYIDMRRSYERHLRYWNWFLKEYDINLFLSGGVPHNIPDYVIYALCKKRGIKTLAFDPGPIIDTLFLYESWEDTAPSLPSLYEKYKKQGGSPTLSKGFEDFYQKHARERKKSKPWDMTTGFPSPEAMRVSTLWIASKRSPAYMLNVLRSIATAYWWRKQWIHIIRKINAKRMRKWYGRHAVEPDLSQPYIYVPLHLQPEASTCPFGGVFVNQLLVIQLLAHCLPKDVFLYVKEHPNQYILYPEGKGRSFSFYHDLLSTPSVRLIPHSCNTFDLIEHSKAVATVTGSVGFEALFREKPVMIFGHRECQHAPGAYPIRSVEDCKKAVRDIFVEQKKPNKNNMRYFLKALEEVLIRGRISSTIPWNNLPTALSEEENRHSLVSALQTKLIAYYARTFTP